MHFQKQIAGASDGVALTLFGIAADKLDGLAHVMLAEMWMLGRGTDVHGGYALLHYCIACLLLPHGSNRVRAESQRDLILAQHPSMRAMFGTEAEAYVAARVKA